MFLVRNRADVLCFSSSRGSVLQKAIVPGKERLARERAPSPDAPGGSQLA